jgi:hypothetical protein
VGVSSRAEEASDETVSARRMNRIRIRTVETLFTFASIRLESAAI